MFLLWLSVTSVSRFINLHVHILRNLEQLKNLSHGILKSLEMFSFWYVFSFMILAVFKDDIMFDLIQNKASAKSKHGPIRVIRDSRSSG